ncbi:MAG: DUF1704 domain-containing protein [Myxococcales bacterium]|nr:DUF1704 domain-containing protein [Myxococcales bacterium]
MCPIVGIVEPIRDAAREAITRAAPLFELVGRQTRLLDALAWPREVEERFFEQGEQALPEPSYEIDRARAQANVIELEQLAMTLDVQDPVQHWLASQCRSYADGNRMILAIGTKRFSEISVDVFGGPRSRFDADTTNLDLARHLEQRILGVEARIREKRRRKKGVLEPREADTLDAPAFAAEIEAMARGIGLAVEVVVDDRVTAKVAAGTERVRVRKGARFHRWELEGLFVHEVETHALTAQNGAACAALPFLKSGGPRTTRHQEGLAVFAEFQAHALPVERMERIVRRVRLVAMAEDGADFLELYRFLVAAGQAPREAYFDAQRICRGGLVQGGAPFTKDSAYLAGFMEVFNFLQVAVRGGAREEVELLACGRISLDDLVVLRTLRRAGLLEKPRRLPRWMQRWHTLVPFFAVSSFLAEIDLESVASRYHALLADDEADPLDAARDP